MTTATPLSDHELPAKDEERAYYELNRRVYPRLAPFYDFIAAPLARVRREVACLTGTASGKRVLDVATGTGSQAMAFAATRADVTGVDISPAMLNKARAKNRFGNLRFELGDGTKLRFTDGAFDVSSISFALHEMPATVRARVVSEMARVTKPGGVLVVVDYGLPKNRLLAKIVFRLVSLYERDHYPEFVRSDWHDLLRKAGARVRLDRTVLAGNARIVVAEVGARFA